MGFWHIYMGIDLNGSGESPAIVTTRLTLIGTSNKRLALVGTSKERLDMAGTSGKRLTIEGASR